jgi:hypothetical protein
MGACAGRRAHIISEKEAKLRWTMRISSGERETAERATSIMRSAPGQLKKLDTIFLSEYIVRCTENCDLPIVSALKIHSLGPSKNGFQLGSRIPSSRGEWTIRGFGQYFRQ